MNKYYVVKKNFTVLSLKQPNQGGYVVGVERLNPCLCSRDRDNLCRRRSKCRHCRARDRKETCLWRIVMSLEIIMNHSNGTWGDTYPNSFIEILSVVI
jgi:hypothetical protein